MLPKTELRISIIYRRRYDSKFSKNYLREVRGKFTNFIFLYKNHISKILEFIEKENEFWKIEYIPVYLTLNIKPFSDPLTLRYNKNPKYILVVLIHELIHNNLTKNFYDKGEMHKFIQNILRKVCEKLGEDFNKEIQELGKTYF